MTNKIDEGGGGGRGEPVWFPPLPRDAVTAPSTGLADRLVPCALTDLAARPLIDGLVADYDRRYGVDSRPGGALAEILRYPAAAFAPPLGAFLLLQRHGRTIAGGAFMSHDDETAELKRIWTAPDLRRQGLARRIVLALEDAAAALGYTRAYLSTGFRQPEATALYQSLGYRPLFDPAVDPQLYRSLPFEKAIGARAGQTLATPVLPPAVSLNAATARVNAYKAEQEARILARLARHGATTDA